MIVGGLAVAATAALASPASAAEIDQTITKAKGFRRDRC